MFEFLLNMDACIQIIQKNKTLVAPVYPIFSSEFT